MKKVWPRCGTTFRCLYNNLISCHCVKIHRNRSAYIVMSSKPTGADINLAYPQAEIAVMGAAGAVNILYRKLDSKEKEEIIKDYEDKFSNPYHAAERGLIDEVIMPRDTRYKLVQALEMSYNKNQSNPPKKHGNMPL